MQRRTLMGGAAAAAAVSALPNFSIAQTAAQRVLRFVPQANLSSLDPLATTAVITRNHGYMVYDTLYGMDDRYQPQPQMAEGARFENGGRTCDVTLRAGLKFHDGEMVRARDCVASLNRWMKRSPMGQKLEATLNSLTAVDDRTLRFDLKRPFPLLLTALGSLNSPVPFIMPERLAVTDPFTNVREAVGSGPFKFLPAEYNNGSFMAWERFADYSPTPVGQPSLTAGPKLAKFERIQWHVIADSATATAALQNNEVDWFEEPTPEQQQLLGRRRDLTVERLDPGPFWCLMRFNHLQAPFNDKRMRQALLPALSQSDFMMAIVGTNPNDYVADSGFFLPNTPFATDVGLGPLKGPRNLDRAKQLLREAGYANQPVRLIGPTDDMEPMMMTQVAADVFGKVGLNVDLAMSDWGTVLQRRNNRGPVSEGGWSVFCTGVSSFDALNPIGHNYMRGNGADGWFGWPDAPQLETLRNQWFDAPDFAAQKRISDDMQRVAMDELPAVPIGCFYSNTALRKDLRDRVPGFSIFWNIRRG
ncbi:ABC transporter substrate-binding protein [Roseococcus pinisoli]|uniref:ABC transporter substrate-binding protein n=1 Tax=Roseococcus pinisoli TaxID=2835040 RepID=A0ABS5QDU1_9PROT|nr:ABC transporter substrate-binding protein [Roseococcus pinisoli]MBS7811876.1 ABC transporter substrate-binding protein [Roseococcus pinisoli]